MLEMTSAPSPPPYYTLMSDELSWGDANAACLAAGLQLATVQSAAESALCCSPLRVAIGCGLAAHRSDAASEGAWVWSPCNTPLSYTDGYIGEPNNAGGGQDCMEIKLREINYKPAARGTILLPC